MNEGYKVDPLFECRSPASSSNPDLAMRKLFYIGLREHK